MAVPGFFKKFLSHLGFRKEPNEERSQRSRGFATKIVGPAPGALTDGPVISQCNYGNGGVQGFKWYSEMLQADSDGDVAHEFLREKGFVGNDQRKRLRLEADRGTRSVKLKGPLCALNGNVHQFVEFGGGIHWA